MLRNAYACGVPSPRRRHQALHHHRHHGTRSRHAHPGQSAGPRPGSGNPRPDGKPSRTTCGTVPVPDTLSARGQPCPLEKQAVGIAMHLPKRRDASLLLTLALYLRKHAAPRGQMQKAVFLLKSAGRGRAIGASGAAALSGVKPAALISRPEKMGMECRMPDAGRPPLAPAGFRGHDGPCHFRPGTGRARRPGAQTEECPMTRPFRAGALAAATLAAMLPGSALAGAPASWLGGYLCEIKEPLIIYGIEIREKGGETLADIDGDGFQTLMRIRARATGDERSIQLRFKEAREGNALAFFSGDELLLTLERQDGRLLTRWGAIGTGRAPEVCFARTGAAGAGPAGRESMEADPLAAAPGLREAVAAWDEAVRKALQAFNGLSPAEADRLYASDASPLKRLEDAKAYQDADKASQPLFARWGEAGFDDARLSPADRACFDELARHGLARAMSEGTPFFLVDAGAVEEPLYGRLSPSMAGYARLKKSQPAFFVEDAGRRFSVARMLGWAAEWERFVKAGAAGQGRRSAVERYEYLMELCLFSVLDNTPAFPGGRMAEDVRRDLQEGARRLQGSVTGRLAGDYVRDVKAGGWKYSKQTERRYRQQLRQAFQAGQ